MITTSQPSWLALFTGLSPQAFRTLVGQLRREGADTLRPGHLWSLSLEDRVLLVATYWRTNLTLRQLGPLLGVSNSAADLVVDLTVPLLALQRLVTRCADLDELEAQLAGQRGAFLRLFDTWIVGTGVEAGQPLPVSTVAIR